MTLGKPFIKGQSGNPSGRPKETAQVKELARQHTREAVERLVGWMRSDNGKASVAACNVILDRGWGKASQNLDINVKHSFVDLLKELEHQRRTSDRAVGTGVAGEPEGPVQVRH